MVRPISEPMEPTPEVWTAETTASSKVTKVVIPEVGNAISNICWMGARPLTRTPAPPPMISSDSAVFTVPVMTSPVGFFWTISPMNAIAPTMMAGIWIS